eukprot:3532348-Pleurochrysis_carterae.AAC.1
MKTRQAYMLLLHANCQHLDRKELEALVDSKFRLVAALQRYAVMSESELDDVELLLAEFPSLSIAYIAEVKRPVDQGGTQFFSCFVDGSCALGQDKRRKPKFTIRLPGHPILGNGKSDNQNQALIYTRGLGIQARLANPHFTALAARISTRLHIPTVILTLAFTLQEALVSSIAGSDLATYRV